MAPVQRGGAADAGVQARSGPQLGGSAVDSWVQG
jgi:hypothetical protein